MLPLLDRPFLERLLSRLRGHGVTHALLTLHHHPEQIRDHFGDGASLGLAMDYLVEEQPLGTAGGVKALEGLLTGTFVVCNGDIFTDLDLRAALAFHRRVAAQATIVLTHADDPTAFGMVETDGAGRVLRFVEKPAPERVTTHWVNAGTYILEPQVLRYAPQGEPFMFEGGLFPRLLEEGEAVYAFPSDAYWTDMGTPAAYLRLHADLLRAAQASNSSATPCAPASGPTPRAASPSRRRWSRRCSSARGARYRRRRPPPGAADPGRGVHRWRPGLSRATRSWGGKAASAPAPSVEGCILGEGVVVGAGARVGPGCMLGDGAQVSAGVGPSRRRNAAPRRNGVTPRYPAPGREAPSC